MIAVSSLVYRFERLKTTLEQARTKWQQGFLESELMTLLNLTLPCGELCPARLMISLGCIWNEPAILTLTLHLRIMDLTIPVFTAHALYPEGKLSKQNL